jgi:hypothetical protein
MNGFACGFVGICVLLQPAFGAEFYVSPAGDDSRAGTRDQPLATPAAARDAARKAGAGPHRIVLLPGDYFLEKPLVLDARDNGLTLEAAVTNSAVLYGGRPVTGWRKDGDALWCADLPGVREGMWDFRALVVNGRMPERARLPAVGTFTHQSVFDVKWLSSVGGGWERKPTQEELTTLRYDAKDLPSTLDTRNAEVRVYHMWDESLVGVASNDVTRHVLTFSTPAKSPAGAFGVKKYAVFNTREGMTRAGQWYLDRMAGRVVYWPLPGEDMAKVRVVAPVLERVVSLAGTAKAPVEKITLRGLSLQATTTPLKPAGFGAGLYDGALNITYARLCAAENLEICNVGGQGIQSWNLTACRIEGCSVHHTGACGIRAGGSACAVSRNHIRHVGVYHPSAVALQASHTWSEAEPKGFHLYRNEIHDTPYSGIIGGGGGHLIEENLIYRVMLELQDGGAIYGGIKKSVLRGNVVRDVVKMGEGYGVSSYYLDEGAEDCVVERNVSIGVERPTHNHIASDLVIRDNVFIAEADMTLSFPRSRRCAFTGNTVFAPGKVTVSPPNAVTLWTNNVVIHSGLGKGGVPQPFAIGDAMPAAAAPGRRAYPVAAARVPQPPVLDGEIGADEWPGSSQNIDREPSRWSASGAPAFAEFAYDDRCLYVAVNVVLFDIGTLSKGGEWGKDDGAEICVAGDKGVFVLRGFADGTLKSAADGGVPAEAAARLGKEARFAAKTYGKTKGDWKSGWRGEWALPFEALGLKPETGKKIAFNLGLYRSEDSVWRCLEGTLAENWRLAEAVTLQFK